MKVCIYGAGAIGGHLAARLVSSGKAEVSVVARGANLAAMRSSAGEDADVMIDANQAWVPDGAAARILLDDEPLPTPKADAE